MDKFYFMHFYTSYIKLINCMLLTIKQTINKNTSSKIKIEFANLTLKFEKSS